METAASANLWFDGPEAEKSRGIVLLSDKSIIGCGMRCYIKNGDIVYYCEVFSIIQYYFYFFFLLVLSKKINKNNKKVYIGIFRKLK